MHVLDPFFLHVSHGVGRLLYLLYKVSVVIFGQARLHLKLQ